MKAIIFIDVQKDFIDGVLRNEKAIKVTPKIVDFAKDVVNNSDVKLYATLDTHEKTKSMFHFDGDKKVDEPISGYLTTLEGQNLPIEHCVEGSEGWEIHDDLWNVINGKCTIVIKNTFGSFDLAEIIAEDFETDTLDEIIFCGFCTSICVLANTVILRAKFPNVKITVMKDLCACVTDESHQHTIESLKMQQIEII